MLLQTRCSETVALCVPPGSVISCTSITKVSGDVLLLSGERDLVNPGIQRLMLLA